MLAGDTVIYTEIDQALYSPSFIVSDASWRYSYIYTEIEQALYSPSFIVSDASWRYSYI